ncbi:unnamed protein product [Allacma fusca]|uniref:Uncharacterized protein n=1 Tax=Allacma fusca TaxID=39272 RepID=A0A8J2PK22_9HEXA|nr:unnamed protein product [Allacma fusca]
MSGVVPVYGSSSCPMASEMLVGTAIMKLSQPPAAALGLNSVKEMKGIIYTLGPAPWSFGTFLSKSEKVRGEGSNRGKNSELRSVLLHSKAKATGGCVLFIDATLGGMWVYRRNRL